MFRRCALPLVAVVAMVAVALSAGCAAEARPEPRAEPPTPVVLHVHVDAPARVEASIVETPVQSAALPAVAIARSRSPRAMTIRRRDTQ